MAIRDTVDVLVGIVASTVRAARPRHHRCLRAVGRARLVVPRAELLPVPAYQRRRRTIAG